MPSSPSPSAIVRPAPPAFAASRLGIALAGGALFLAILAAYANSLAGPFVYDDQPSIVENPTLRQLWTALAPPGGGITVSGRPVLNLTLALNYAIGGTNVRGYHAANTLIHAFAALALFGLVRRILLQPILRGRFGATATPLALATAAVWGLQPLQTEAVSYVVQRAESLMGMFYLLTLYFFIRGEQSPQPARWRALSIAACFLGMGTKEVIASAPVMVLLFDRTFVAGTFAAAWRQRRRFYLGLAATWIFLGALVLGAGGNRGGSVGFGAGVSWWDYALTQFPALARYLALSVWPQPLAFDYGTFWIQHFADVAVFAALVVALLAGALVALWRRPVGGFLGAWFFVILAPTSLLPGTTQMIVEHRMYLALAAVTALAVPGIFLLGGRRMVAGSLAAALALGLLTFRRNADYCSELVLWQDTVAKRPANATAHANLGSALAEAHRPAEALVEDETALRLQPTNVAALSNLGNVLTELGRPAEALPKLEAALRLNPNYAEAHLNLGVALDIMKRAAQALPHYAAAWRLKPWSPHAHNNLGDALSRAGKTAEGIAHLEEALRLKPDYLEAHYNLASALARAGRLPEAQAQFAAGLRLKPDDAEAHANWANALFATGHTAEALAQYELAIRLRPGDAASRYNYGSVLAAAGRLEEAVPQFTEALRLKPDYAEAHDNLGNALTLLHREPEALPHFEEALRLQPDNPLARNNLGLALARLGRIAEAAAQFAEAVRLAPNFAEARDNLARARAELSAPERKN